MRENAKSDSDVVSQQPQNKAIINRIFCARANCMKKFLISTANMQDT